MSNVVYDLCLLTPAEINIDVVGSAIEGGRSLSGVTQSIDYSGGGFVAVTYGGINLFSRAQHQHWNQLAGILNGSVDYIRVPLWTDFTGPTQTQGPISIDTAAALGATTVTVTSTFAPVAGQWFNIAHAGAVGGNRAYRISSVGTSAPPFYTVTIRPALRAAVPTGTAGTFWRPSLRMRLPAGETMAWQFRAPGVTSELSVNFVEAF